MNYRNILIMTLIILILAAGYIFYKDVELDPQNAIVSYIERQSGFRVNYSSAKLWPLNEIIIEDLNLVGDKFILKVPKVNIGYSIFDYFNETTQVGKIIKYIDLNSPELVYNSSENANQPSEMSFSEIKNNIFSEVDELYINIKNGHIDFNNRPEANYVLSSLDTEIKIKSKEKNIVADVKRGFKLKGSIFNGVNLKDYPTNNFKISAELTNNSWDLYLKNDSVNINEYEKLIYEYGFNEISNYQFDNLKGNVKIDLHVKGEKENIESYKSNIDLVDGSLDFKLKDKSVYEKLNIKEAKLHLDSTEEKVYLDNIVFSINEIALNFQGIYNFSNKNYSGELNSKNLKVDDKYINRFLTEEIGYNFSTEGHFHVNLDGDLEDVNIISELYIDSLIMSGYQFSDINADIRYLDGSIYLDNLNSETINGGILNIEGLYNISKNQYQLAVKGEDIRPLYYYDKINTEEISNNTSYDLKNYIKGEVNFNLTTTGSGDIFKNFSKGSFDFEPDRENHLREKGIREISSNFLYENNKFFLNNGNIKINGSNLNLFGELNLKESNIYVKLRGEDIDLANLDHNFDFKIADENEISIDTLIQGDFTDPFVKGKIESNSLSYQDYNISDVLVDFTYEEKTLNIRNLNFIFDKQRFDVKGNLELNKDLKLGKTNLDLAVSTGFINYNKVKKYIDFNLPLKGKVKSEMRLYGTINDLKAEGNFISDDTEVSIGEYTYLFDHIDTLLNWSFPANVIKIENGVIRKDDFNIVLDGQYKKDNIDINFSANNLELNKLKFLPNAGGTFNLKGNIVGEIKDPRINFDFTSNNFRYNKFLTDQFTGQITYNNDIFKFTNIKLKNGSSIYNIEGQVNNIIKDPDMNIEVNTDRGNLKELARLTDYDIPYNLNYVFDGEIGLKGKLNKPELTIDVSILNNFTEIVDIKGEVTDQINLKLAGKEVPLNLIEVPDSFEEEFNYSGDLSFEGQLSGTLKDYSLDLNTQLENPEFAGIQFDDIIGNISYNSDGRLKLTQNLSQSEQQFIRLQGTIRTEKNYIKEMQLDINNYDLKTISSINNSVRSLVGKIDGNLSLTGTMSSFELDGEMSLDIPEIKLQNMKAIDSLTGKITFDEEKISVLNVVGKYGEGNFNLSGDINYMNQANFWELELKGNNFSFNRGSFNGKYNPDIKILNKFKKPLIFGNLNVHDFIVESELNWPTSDESIESFFEPQFKLTLIPGNNVYFRDENIDIKVEGGRLKLNYLNQELNFIGNLKSNQGSLDYYNNKFIVDTVTATFEQYGENGPLIHLVGTTTTSGTRIFIYVDGPRDNLNISFGSEPELSEERIITLLTKKGGLGDITTEEGTQADRFILSELFRYIGERFQLDFIQRVERTLATDLNLDRFEIDTYSLAGEREVTFYLGKDITDNLYLQYTGTFSPEIRENEFTFKYDINKYLNLEGGWYGEDDYRFLLETTIEF